MSATFSAVDGTTAAHSILIVDDHPSNRELMAGLLRNGGYRALTATGGEDAFEMARLERPTVIITDVLMSGVNGFELTRRLRGESELDATPILFWTAHYDDREVREMATALQVAGVLPKPCDIALVLEMVGDAVAGATPTARRGPSGDFDREHARVLNDKLVEKADALDRARLELRESEERFRLLVSNIPGAVYRRALDPDLTIEFVSDEIEQITGYPARSLAGNRQRTLASLVHPDDRARMVEEMRAAVQGGRPYGLAYRIVRADGQEAWVGDRGQAVGGGDGGVAWLYGTLSDITERKRLEADRERMELELRMAQKLEAVGQLAAGIAHEINTPIQFVGDSVQFLRDAFEDLQQLLSDYRDACVAVADGPAVDTLQASLERADEAADVAYLQERVPAAFERTLEGVERVASIVRAMKEFAHPQSEQAPADLNQALRTTLTVARSEYKYVAEVETELARLPPVVCNLSDLNQVFLNLIVNAAHAIEDARTDPNEQGTILIRTARDGDTVVISIGDSGDGIPPEIRGRIFDPFFTTKEVGRGSGQGLAIARAIVDKHAGTLALDTELGAGTTFTIRLPIAGAQAAQGIST
ncbi:MAG: ATP-binding protein [Solirubrobacteraceae bacterium]